MNWSELGKKVADYAPLLGTAIGGPVGTGIGSIVASAFGTGNDPDQITAAISQDPEAAIKLKEIELRHKSELERIAVERDKAELEDKQSAREAHKNSNMPAIITITLTVISCLYGLGLFFVEFPDSNRDMLNYFGGQLIALWFSSVVYWVGTTRSSSDKNRLLALRK